MSKADDLNSKVLIEIGRGNISVLREVTEQLQRITSAPYPAQEQQSTRDAKSPKSAESE